MTDAMTATFAQDARNDELGYQGADDSPGVTRDCHRRAVGVAMAPAAGMTDGRTVDVLICRWDDPHTVSDDGRISYTEVFARGGLVPAGRVLVRNEHDPDSTPGVTHRPGTDPARHGVVVGQLAETFVRADGLYGRIRVVDNDDGRRLLGWLDPAEPIIDSLSIEFDDVFRPIRPGDTVVRSAARLTGLVFTVNPQRGDARVLAVRSQPKETAMSDTPDPVEPDEPATPDEPERRPAVRSNVVTMERSAPRPGAATITSGFDVDQVGACQFLHQYRSFGEFCRAAALTRDSDVIAQHQRSLGLGVQAAAQVQSFRRAWEEAALADIAGLLPPQWLSDVIDLYRQMTPTVQNWSSSPLPADGTVFQQPIVGDRPLAAAQASESTVISSNKVTVVSATWNMVTVATGQGMSRQVMERSTPDYVSIVMSLFAREMARAWNQIVATGLLAAADDVNTTGLEYTTAAAFGDIVIDASAAFLTALGRPAEVVAMSPFLWKEVGKAKDSTGRYLFPQIGPMNVSGSFDATSPVGQIQGISYYVEPSWSTTLVQGVVGVREAYRSMTGAIQTLSADMPQDLTRDVAVYQYGAHGKADATGLALIVNAV